MFKKSTNQGNHSMKTTKALTNAESKFETMHQPVQRRLKGVSDMRIARPKSNVAVTRTKKADNAYAWAEANLKKPTKADARKLRIGDVIEIFYNDDKSPVAEVVIEACAADGDIWDVKTISETKWNSRKRDDYARSVNSDYWRLIGTLKFSIEK
jgi:hypothetical protein